MRVALFDSPWELELPPSHRGYRRAAHAHRFQDTWGADEHESFWLAELPEWPKRGRGGSTRETLGYVRQYWRKHSVADDGFRTGVTNGDAARAMRRSKGSMGRINDEADRIAERRHRTREALVDALGDGIDDLVANENRESVRWRLPRVVTVDDPGLVSSRGETISYRALTPDDRVDHDERWRQAVAAQYELDRVYRSYPDWIAEP